MDVDSGPLGDMGAKSMRLAYLPGKWMPNWMWISHPPGQNELLCSWVWHDVGLLNAEIIAWHCRAVHAILTVCNDRHAKQKRDEKGTP